eukprot:Selendium_serpulae@DN5089_c0_g1_i8.p1
MRRSQLIILASFLVGVNSQPVPAYFGRFSRPDLIPHGLIPQAQDLIPRDTLSLGLGMLRQPDESDILAAYLRGYQIAVQELREELGAAGAVDDMSVIDAIQSELLSEVPILSDFEGYADQVVGAFPSVMGLPRVDVTVVTDGADEDVLDMVDHVAAAVPEVAALVDSGELSPAAMLALVDRAMTEFGDETLPPDAASIIRQLLRRASGAGAAAPPPADVPAGGLEALFSDMCPLGCIPGETCEDYCPSPCTDNCSPGLTCPRICAECDTCGGAACPAFCGGEGSAFPVASCETFCTPGVDCPVSCCDGCATGVNCPLACRGGPPRPGRSGAAPIGFHPRGTGLHPAHPPARHGPGHGPLPVHRGRSGHQPGHPPTGHFPPNHHKPKRPPTYRPPAYRPPTYQPPRH